MTKSNDCDKEVLKTYEVKECQDNRLNEVSWWERKKKKTVIQEALDYFLATKKEVPCKK
jgi:hypothetical protein